MFRGENLKKKIIVVSPTKEKRKDGSAASVKLKVAAYCRVSSESDEQLNSLSVQRKYFEGLLSSHPNWENAGIFYDEGVSGTLTNRRAGFNNMIANAIDGKIDLIIVKSISRFARNTVDALNTIRLLKSKGIRLIFEKEGLDTLDTKSEFILTIMSSLAQQESQSLSENVKWGIRKSFAEGKVSKPAFLYGYKYDGKYAFSINKNEAKIVCLIYKMYLEKTSRLSIAVFLNKAKIPTAWNRGKKEWGVNTITHILANEKYCGDAILQKTYVPDFMTHRTLKNDGKLTKYIVKNNHEPIIPRPTWDLTQEMLASKKNFYVSKTIFALMIKCPICGSYYQAKTQSRPYLAFKFRYYECENKQRKKKDCKKSPDITEIQLESLFHEAIFKLYEEFPDVIEALTNLTNKIIKNKRRQSSINNKIKKKPTFSITPYERTTWKTIVDYAELTSSTITFHFINGLEMTINYTKWKPAEHFPHKRK